MTSIIRLQPRAVQSTLPLYRFCTAATTMTRTYAQSSSAKNPNSERSSHSNTTESQDNYQIPSNKAHPTLRDGKQSPMADMDGTLREDLPQDVKQHNEEVEQRHDHPYNHIADKGSV